MKYNIHQKINIRALAKEFPKVADKQFQERFRKLKIGVTGELMNSMGFRGSVLVDGVMVEIDYFYYGIFTAYGVGNGISLEDVNVTRLIGSGRKKKNWLKGLAHMRHRLGELYTKVVADELSQYVNESYDRTLRFRV
ncbi:hypothetical protein DN752_21150 [Echinicola strongylocentroti]|uniref:Uncharacterized protein n=1 Tax=Echinicola strongylocentroti TaxID=1795355 RepID=A0A2Z4IMW3_9BACT|nr:hypothetical protein [Echinicola strongylocentroti]AWW32451.1 hypothetical protein DN752_21150 [Echinicola strongylocentroti]